MPEELPDTNQLIERILNELMSINVRLSRLEDHGSTPLPSQDPIIIDLLSRVARMEKILETTKEPFDFHKDDYLSDKGKVAYNYSTNHSKATSSAQEVHANSPSLGKAQGRRIPKQYTPIGMTYSQAFDRLVKQNVLAPIGPTDDPPADKKTKYWDPNTYCEYHRGRGHRTDTCFRLKDQIQSLIDQGAIQLSQMHTTSNCENTFIGVTSPDEGFVTKNPPLGNLGTCTKPKVSINPGVSRTIRAGKLKRLYTPLTAPIGEVFDKLAAEGYLTHIGPTLDPPAHRRSKIWDSSSYCKYHRGWGHETDSCLPLQDKIQDLIDKGVIAAPSARES